MASSISWLDASTEEQRRNREILGLFTDRESREELGLGQIRDSLGDGLFPGTSTLHTRARYLLFVPWVFQSVAKAGGTLADVRTQENQLIFALRSVAGTDEGVIGARAGEQLVTTASSMYWSALGTYGILLNSHLSREQAVSNVALPSDIDEVAGRNARVWRPAMPMAPSGFPLEVEGGMELQKAEAEWLRERVVSANPDSFYAHLLTCPPGREIASPWEDPSALTASREARRLLGHARYFSKTMYGAQLLYNLLIAESYEDMGFDRHEGRRQVYEDALVEWAVQQGDEPPLEDWLLGDFFLTLAEIRGRPIGAATQEFVRQWVEVVSACGPSGVIYDPAARKLVRDRERRNKGKMARIGNPKRLKTWGGSSGAGRYTFRWPTAKRILVDIHQGLAGHDREATYV